MGEIPKGWTVKPVDNAPPEGWDVQVGDPDFSDVQGSAASEPIPNTYQMSQDPAAGRAMGFIGGLPKGPELAAYIQSKVGNRQVSPEEMKAFLGSQQALTPSQYGQGETAGKITPSILTAIATSGASLPQQAGAQGLTSYLQSRLGGKGVVPSALEGGFATGLTGAGGLAAKGVGLAAADTADYMRPILKNLADNAIMKQWGYIGAPLKKLFQRKGDAGVSAIAESIGGDIRPTVRGTAERGTEVVDQADLVRQNALKAIDASIGGQSGAPPGQGIPTVDEIMKRTGISRQSAESVYQRLGGGPGQSQTASGMPTIGTIVQNAKDQLTSIVKDKPKYARAAQEVLTTLDDHIAQWGADTQSFSKADELRQALADLGKFDQSKSTQLTDLYRQMSGVVRNDIDSRAITLAGGAGKDFLGAKNVLSKYIEPAKMAADRARELGGQSVLGLIGSGGLTSAAALAASGRPLAAAGSAALAFAQKPARQWANYGLAKGANAAANYLGSESAPSIGGLLTSGGGKEASGVAGSLMSKRLYPDQVGQLAERLGAPQAAQLKRAAETDPSNADALHRYMLANNQDYQAVMGTAGTSKDRRQP